MAYQRPVKSVYLNILKAFCWAKHGKTSEDPQHVTSSLIEMERAKRVIWDQGMLLLQSSRSRSGKSPR